MAFLDIDVPVDEALTSGTTPLHIASFADQLNTTNLLLTVYKADKLKTDKYVWKAKSNKACFIAPSVVLTF